MNVQIVQIGLLLNKLRANTTTITSEVGEEVMHFPRQLHILKEHVRAWVMKDAIDTVHVSIYIKYLFENHSSPNYAFFCPTNLSDGNNDSEKKARYMVDSMSKLEKDNHIWFVPYYNGIQ